MTQTHIACIPKDGAWQPMWQDQIRSCTQKSTPNGVLAGGDSLRTRKKERKKMFMIFVSFSFFFYALSREKNLITLVKFIFSFTYLPTYKQTLRQKQQWGSGEVEGGIKVEPCWAWVRFVEHRTPMECESSALVIAFFVRGSLHMLLEVDIGMKSVDIYHKQLH